jgi:D-inositol-3-phosphate glycosyltransferase
MHVLVATHYWHPHRGGIEVVAHEQAIRLVRRGHRVTALTSRVGADAPEQEMEGVRIVRVRALNLLERIGVPYPLFSPALLGSALSLAARADVVLAHSHAFLGSAVAVAAARLRGRPSVVLQHNTFIHYPQPLRTVERIADLSLGAATLRLASCRLAVSEEARKYVESLHAGRCEVLPNGVDTRRFSPVPAQERAALRAAFGLPEKGTIALSVRRLTLKNGIDTLMEAAVLAPNVHFALAGSGPDRRKLDAFVGQRGLRNVSALGYVPDDKLPDLYRAADLFVLPSHSGEGMPLVILEAFASGVPCVATRSGGQVELIRDGQTGWLVPPGDPESMAASIRAAADADLGAMGRAAREQSEGMDWELQVTRLEERLRALR